MKKILLITGLILAAFFTANAQEISENAIGIRFGDNSGIGGEISYQHRMTENNRLEINLGLRNNKNFDSFKATGIYQWVWNFENRFNWYAGVGAGVGSWKEKETTTTTTSEAFFFGTGDLGIEYNFKAPILISLDYRPELGFSNLYNGINSDIALSVRYQF
jgi:hemolysin activation/secretion protein